ncbi:Acyl-CoA N-acyltransferase [Ascosphaera apis ARSEF 7405]|uniref:Acyl-CoA N-acyltransferase n=1 Tax=Ascosphaera apis ARSEF 7405 TaxID=392613 RepID=A0A167XZG5_9EURO|nr:Acyl-CoA N-acyltransferase [Ascosphaera apis ARSEF 7405]
MVSRPIYKVDLATEPDFDELPLVECRAFSEDVSSQMCFNLTQELYEYRKNDLRRLAADPRWQVLKVTSPEGRICGFSVWHFVPDPEEEAIEKKKKDEEKERKKGTPEEEPECPPGSNPEAFKAFFDGVIYRQRAMVAGQKRAGTLQLTPLRRYWLWSRSLYLHNVQVLT